MNNRADRNDLTRYRKLIESFVYRKIDPKTFERDYLDWFKNDATEWSESEYEILNDLFGDVDAFCADPQLCGLDDLSEDQLRQKAQLALEKLEAQNRIR